MSPFVVRCHDARSQIVNEQSLVVVRIGIGRDRREAIKKPRTNVGAKTLAELSFKLKDNIRRDHTLGDRHRVQ